MDASYNFAIFLDADFFFGRSALQNYLSEFLSIAITVFVVDQLIQYRHRRINRPLRNIGYVRLFDELDDFIRDFVPVSFYDISKIRDLRFGSYSTFVVRTLKDFKDNELYRGVREYEAALERSVILFKNNDEIYNDSIRELNLRAQNLISFENRIQFIIEHYSMHFTNNEVQVLNEICLNINQHFSTYKNSVTGADDIDKFNLSHVVPGVAEKIVSLWQRLLYIGFRNEKKS